MLYNISCTEYHAHLFLTHFANILIEYRDDWWKKNRNKNEML